MNIFKNIRMLGNIGNGQDGAIYNGCIFHMDVDGKCSVYSFPDIKPISSFMLGRIEHTVPHSNSVCFGNERFDASDEFPLLYCNVYNNYQNENNKRKGECCVYRLQRNENTFSADLIQLIKIDFTENRTLWHSKNTDDIRPYGNFVTDNENGLIYAFVMRDESRKTRFFKFALPSKDDGEKLDASSVKTVKLRSEDILEYFDCDYTEFMQGAAFHKEHIYSVEGFNESVTHMPALKVFDVNTQKTVLDFKFKEIGINLEPEFIDVYDGKLYYADAAGNMYELII